VQVTCFAPALKPGQKMIMMIGFSQTVVYSLQEKTPFKKVSSLNCCPKNRTMNSATQQKIICVNIAGKKIFLVLIVYFCQLSLKSIKPIRGCLVLTA
jgi:hypothetical protein